MAHLILPSRKIGKSGGSAGGEGFTIFRSDQCPYIPDATQGILDFAEERGIRVQVVELKSAFDVQELAPSPYGTFSIVYNGKLLSYHYLLPKDLEKLIGDGPL